MNMTFIIRSIRRPCNLGVSQSIKSKFIDIGYFDLFSSKMVFIFKFKACIMGNMGGLVTLVFFKIESKHLVSWGILM